MDDVIEVENYIDEKWIRHVHLMSNHEYAEVDLPSGVKPTIAKETGVWHVRASWAVRSSFSGTMRGADRIERQITIWALRGERVSVCIKDAARAFWNNFGRRPNFAAVHEYPESMGLDVDVEIDGGVVALVECADVPKQFVMVF